MDSGLVKYFIEQTNVKFAEVKEELHAMNETLVSFRDFQVEAKAEARAAARWVSISISGVVSVLGVVISSWLKAKWGG